MRASDSALCGTSCAKKTALSTRRVSVSFATVLTQFVYDLSEGAASSLLRLSRLDSLSTAARDGQLSPHGSSQIALAIRDPLIEQRGTRSASRVKEEGQEEEEEEEEEAKRKRGARTYTHASGQRVRHWRSSVAGLRPGEKNSRDAEAIADGDESFPLNGLPCVDLHLLSTQEAG